MSDEQIIETADKWRQQERADKLKQRARGWSFFKTCILWVLAAACIAGIVISVDASLAYNGARRAEQDRLNVEDARQVQRERDANKLRQAERRREQELAWVECVNAIGVDLCTLVGERL